MASSLASSNSAPNSSSYEKPISKNLALSPFSISFPLHKTRLCAIKTSSDGGDAVRSSEDTTAHGADLLRKPTASTPAVDDNEESDSNGGDGGTWMDWEYMILAEIVPLVGFVRMILQSAKYESGGRLSPEHEKGIIDRLLAYHPE